MILYIKHMVCDRCIMAVRDQLENAGLGPVSVRLGEAEFERELSDDEVNKAKSVLEPLGFGFIDDRKKLLAKQIKQAIIRLVHQEKPIFQHRKSALLHILNKNHSPFFTFATLPGIYSETSQKTSS